MLEFGVSRTGHRDTLPGEYSQCVQEYKKPIVEYMSPGILGDMKTLSIYICAFITISLVGDIRRWGKMAGPEHRGPVSGPGPARSFFTALRERFTGPGPVPGPEYRGPDEKR
jgi:hypothetical protein